MPGGRGKITGSEGNTFSSTNQPANRGRKKKLFTQFFEAQKAAGIEPASRETVTQVIQYMLGMESPEIMEIMGNPKQANGYPFLMRLLAKELMGNNGLATLREMLDRSNGKATQPLDIQGEMHTTTSSFNYDALTTEQKRAWREMMKQASSPQTSPEKTQGDEGETG